MPSSQACEIKSGLFGACGKNGAGLCQYCGRPFCSNHGEFLEESQEVCSRKNCIAKKEDLVKHLMYKSSVLALNEGRRCGGSACDQPLLGQCARCLGYFCGKHIKARNDTVTENAIRTERMALLCEHCWVRRPIWTRV